MNIYKNLMEPSDNEQHRRTKLELDYTREAMKKELEEYQQKIEFLTNKHLERVQEMASVEVQLTAALEENEKLKKEVMFFVRMLADKEEARQDPWKLKSGEQAANKKFTSQFQDLAAEHKTSIADYKD